MTERGALRKLVEPVGDASVLLSYFAAKFDSEGMTKNASKSREVANALAVAITRAEEVLSQGKPKECNHPKIIGGNGTTHYYTADVCPDCKERVEPLFSEKAMKAADRAVEMIRDGVLRPTPDPSEPTGEPDYKARWEELREYFIELAKRQPSQVLTVHDVPTLMAGMEGHPKKDTEGETYE